eukprot:Hpha_TRINITY_DN11009_c1_g2::TRINITY_DN11009_c1_g2_i1::g.92636::m.92636
MGAPVLWMLLSSCTANCANWKNPKNSANYPLWPYCNRRPNDGQTLYQFMADVLQPADQAPYQCQGSGKVLKGDAAGLLCVNYGAGDEYAGACTDDQCCVNARCDSYTCSNGWTQKGSSSSAVLNCFHECNDETCCNPDPSLPLPTQQAQGIHFVDRDGALGQYGGEVTIYRANDETDITHYVLYWAYGKAARKAPSCGVRNPVSWTQFNWKGTGTPHLIGEYPVTGCDIKVQIPMGTRAPTICTPWTNRGNVDPCVALFLIVATKNAAGELPVIGFGGDGPSPTHAVADYESSFGLPCMESGIAFGHDLPGINDVVLGTGIDNPKACQQLCQDYPETDANGNPNKGWPCRFWQWSYPTGGPTASKCWLETQTNLRQAYGVRFGGPAVCMTPNDAEPTGEERPRCNRWVRYQDTDFRGADFGGIYDILTPTGGVMPLGPYENQEMCQAQCDADPVCIGFIFRKRDPGHVNFHKCFLLRKDVGYRITNTQFDTWLCSRENMAPLMHGFELQAHPFGYKKCTHTPAATEFSVSSIECCAGLCGDGCTHFTYYPTGTCITHTSCTLTSVSKVTGCAFESCYIGKGYGAATYAKQSPSVQIVSRWPVVDGPNNGVKVPLEAKWLEGKRVACAIQKSGISASTYAGIAALGGALEATITDSRALITFFKDTQDAFLDYGQSYDIKCGIEDFGAVATAVDTPPPPGFEFLGEGYCRSNQGETGYGKGGGYTVLQCADHCREDTACIAFFWRANDGWCGIRTNYNYYRTNTVSGIFCFRVHRNPDAVNVHSIGNGNCENECSGYCRTVRKPGDFTRNSFMPMLTYPVCAAPAGSSAAAGSLPTRSPTTSPTTSAPTKAPTTSTPTKAPTKSPIPAPTSAPILPPSAPPTAFPSTSPTVTPSKSPDRLPQHVPHRYPQQVPRPPSPA